MAPHTGQPGLAHDTVFCHSIVKAEEKGGSCAIGAEGRDFVAVEEEPAEEAARFLKFKMVNMAGDKKSSQTPEICLDLAKFAA
jgi:hypothetical protein